MDNQGFGYLTTYMTILGLNAMSRILFMTYIFNSGTTHYAKNQSTQIISPSKMSFFMEPYINILPKSCAIAFFRFRTTNNNVPLNKLRYLNIPKVDRICLKCFMNEIGSEFHYLFVCPYFKESRSKYLPAIYYNRPNECSYYNLMNSKSKIFLLNLKHFIDIINSELK